MKKFDILTIFPKVFEDYFGESIIKRAKGKGIVAIEIHDLRHWTKDKHRKVDDTPYGGGAGMVLKIEPIYRAVKELQSKKGKSRVILFSAKGKKYTQKEAKRLLKYDQLILICGRYEGVDERVAKFVADEEISIGDYVLTGGEIPAMVVVDSITRLAEGVLGNPDSLVEESFSKIGRDNKYFLEYPHYTKPENFQGWKVPKILLGGNHQKINEWRNKNSSH